MRLKTDGAMIRLWLSANDTYEWAHKSGEVWPCSRLSGKAVYIEIEKSSDNIIEIKVNGRVPGNRVIDDHSELYALVGDKLKEANIVWPNLSEAEKGD